MKKTYLILAASLMLLAAACGSDRGTGSDSDSMITDSAVLDTATRSMDTTTITTDKLSTDSTTVNP